MGSVADALASTAKGFGDFGGGDDLDSRLQLADRLLQNHQLVLMRSTLFGQFLLHLREFGLKVRDGGITLGDFLVDKIKIDTLFQVLGPQLEELGFDVGKLVVRLIGMEGTHNTLETSAQGFQERVELRDLALVLRELLEQKWDQLCNRRRRRCRWR